MTLEFFEGIPINNEREDRFESVHKVYAISGDNKQHITLTGTVRIDFQGTSTNQWHSEDIFIYLRIDLPEDKALKVEQGAPFVTINTIYNANQAVHAGWGVNNFWLELPSDRLLIGPHYASLPIKVRVLVRDTDGWLFRIAYQVTLIGQLVDRKWEYP